MELVHSLLGCQAALQTPDFSVTLLPLTWLLYKLPRTPEYSSSSQELRARKVLRQDCMKSSCSFSSVLCVSKFGAGGRLSQVGGFRDFQPVVSGSRSLNF